MKTNFHTHTYRCKHAKGSDVEYVKAAIESGIKVLGFSDHAPMPFLDGYESYFKMLPTEAEEYMSSISSLKEKYKDEIEIHVGFESEYYPTLFEDSLRLWRSLGAEYIIYGGHFSLGTEWEASKKAAKKPSGDKELIYYTDNCIEAIKTGKFSYIAHTDILNYTADDKELYKTSVERLVRTANEYDTPLELNLLGIREQRNYPSEKFWEIAAPLSPKVIIGVDAHAPKNFSDKESLDAALKLAEKYKLDIINELKFKKL